MLNPCTTHLTLSIFLPRECIHPALNARCQRGNSIIVDAIPRPQSDKAKELFYDALQSASEEDKLLFEEYKDKRTGTHYGRLKAAKPISVRELCTATAQGVFPVALHYPSRLPMTF